PSRGCSPTRSTCWRPPHPRPAAGRTAQAEGRGCSAAWPVPPRPVPATRARGAVSRRVLAQCRRPSVRAARGKETAQRPERLGGVGVAPRLQAVGQVDRKSTRLNSSHVKISYAVFCLKKKKKKVP